MWTINQHIISRSCNAIYNTPNLSPPEIQSLYYAIQTVAHTSRVDHRFILAVIMQETKGCVRASTSVSPDGTVRNPGIMQDHDGTHTCNNNSGKVQTPCPDEQILGMITDGVAGTEKGSGLAGAITSSNDDGVEFAQAYYRGARYYNSGVIDSSGNLEEGTATHCYASDIANRLVGWVDARSECTLDDN
jgi:hypothetical protein